MHKIHFHSGKLALVQTHKSSKVAANNKPVIWGIKRRMLILHPYTESIEFVGVVMRKVVYLGHALTDLSSKTSFGNIIKFHYDSLHKNFSFRVNFIIKTGLEVDEW
jgi:hypothetical protein